MTVGQRSVVPIDPDGADARGARAGDVAVEAVADHHRLSRRDFQSFERQSKNSGVRLSESVITRDDDRLKKAGEVRTLNLGALNIRRTVGEQREAKIFLQLMQHLFCFSENDVAAPSIDREKLGELGGECVVLDA